MLDDKSTRQSIWFGAAVLSGGAAVVSYRDGSALTALLLLLAAAIFIGMSATGASLRLTPRTDGRPHPDDDWFREHPWWDPDRDQATGDTTTGGPPHRRNGQGYRRCSTRRLS